jgi:hypothetical protein
MALLAGGRRLEITAELPDGLQEFRVRGVPQAAAVEVGAQLANGGHELAGPHFGDNLRQLAQGGE